MKANDPEKPEGWKSDPVECPLCGKTWVAVYPAATEVLECPNCGNMIEPIINSNETN
jgi:ribosomal protein S27E